jgi:hypothetical protein
MNSILVTLAPKVLAEAVGISDGEIAMSGFAHRVFPALQRQSALFGRQVDRRAIDRLDDHRRDVLGGADPPSSSALWRRGPEPAKADSAAAAIEAAMSRLMSHSVFIDFLPTVDFSRRRERSAFRYLLLSHGYRAVSFPA